MSWPQPTAILSTHASSWPPSDTSALLMAAPRFTASGGNGAAGLSVAIDSGDTLSDLLDITAGGINLLGAGVFYVHIMESPNTFLRPTDTRWSWFQVPDWATGSETSIYSVLVGYVDANAPRNEILNAIAGQPASIIMASWQYQPSTQSLQFQHRVGSGTPQDVALSGEVLAAGNTVALGFDWQAGQAVLYHNYASGQSISTQTSLAFSPPAGTIFRPIIALLTQSVDDVVSDPLKFRIANNGDTTRLGYQSAV